MKKLLEHYSKAHKTLREYKLANKEVFDTLDTLMQAITNVENEIKETARMIKEDVTHKDVEVKVTKAFKKWYDYTHLEDKTRHILEIEGAVLHEVNRAMFDQLVVDGKISKEERAKSFKEEELTPRITIKIKE